MSPTSLTTHFYFWRLRRLLSRIQKVERDVIGEQLCIDTMGEHQTESAQRRRLEDFKELIVNEETERIQSLKEQAIKAYRTLEETPFGKELLSTGGIEAPHLQLDSAVQRRERVPSSHERPTAPLFRAFQVSWKIVQGAVVATLLCFGLLLVFSSINSASPTYFVTKLGALCLALTVIAAVAHSAISLVASFGERKNQSVLSLLVTWLFEVAFIALCSFFAYQLLKAFVRF